ncbi:MAG: O-antigen ligase family protein [Pyrinomonadaceae bacterium]
MDKAIILFLFLLTASAPLSIAATQISWGIALLLWVIRLFFQPRPVLKRSPVDYPLLAFFLLTVLSSFLSYEPVVSIGKLRAAGLLTIAFLFARSVSTPRLVRALALTLIASCMISVCYTLGARAIGRGVKVNNLTTDSPLRAAGIIEGDSLLQINGHKVSTLDDVLREVTSGLVESRIKVYRQELTPEFICHTSTLLSGTSSSERLGVTDWSRGRDWRATGFYDHYTTYSEALQLIASLVIGLFFALPHKLSWKGALTVAVIVLMGIALILTSTRASWSALIISAFVIAFTTPRKKAMLIVMLGALLIIPVGLYLVRVQRGVGFLDPKDNSTIVREKIWRDGIRVTTESPRHLLFGVGMDSVKRHWQEWGLFDNGRLPVLHLHSTYLQLAFERGVLTLLAWLVFLLVYTRMLWRLIRQRFAQRDEDNFVRGILPGALGGLVGFASSGLVHYNLGDSEVAMIFYIIMGLTLALYHQTIHLKIET